jgi:hypothetical protein
MSYLFKIQFMKKIYLVLIISALVSVNLFSQNNISVKIVSFGINPLNDSNKAIYTSKIDTINQLLTFEPGIHISGEVYGSENTSFKFLQTFHKDQIGYAAGFSQVLISYRFVHTKKHSLNIGIGPILHFRRNWNLAFDYQDNGYFNSNGDLQYKVFWLSGEIEYNYNIKRNRDFSVSLNHLHPKSIGVMFGLKFWFKSVGHCQTCPSYR